MLAPNNRLAFENVKLWTVHDTDNIGTRKSTFSNFVPPFLELPKKSVLVSIGTSISPFRLVFANLKIVNPDVNQCIIRNIPFRKCEEDTWGVKKIGNLYFKYLRFKIGR